MPNQTHWDRTGSGETIDRPALDVNARLSRTRHPRGETARGGLAPWLGRTAYQGDRKLFPKSSGIWLAGDYGPYCENATISS
jgi:hypothetical protein